MYTFLLHCNQVTQIGLLPETCAQCMHIFCYFFFYLFLLYYGIPFFFFTVLRKTIKNLTLIYSIPYELTTISGVWTHFVLTLFVLIYSTNFI